MIIRLEIMKNSKTIVLFNLFRLGYYTNPIAKGMGLLFGITKNLCFQVYLGSYVVGIVEMDYNEA